jgi:hypothetical protein
MAVVTTELVVGIAAVRAPADPRQVAASLESGELLSRQALGPQDMGEQDVVHGGQCNRRAAAGVTPPRQICG